MRIGVVVPCRDEAAVIERKLASLRAQAWPALQSTAEHAVIVVDDGSSDATARIAIAAIADWGAFRVKAAVTRNMHQAGKAGAIRTGIEWLAGGVDLIVLTDADVVLARSALVHLAVAFEREPELGMASGSQRFVLALDGTEGSPQVEQGVATFYDRATASVRTLESRFGRLFSVHGQLLAWRANLGLVPRPGIAADDIDLREQVRARSRQRRVQLVPNAQFIEEKPSGAAAEDQALRRARAFVQIMGEPAPSRSREGVDRLQWALYARVPLALPWLLPLGLVLALGLSWQFGGSALLLAGSIVCAVMLVSPPGRRLVRLARLIAQASALERQSPLSDRWEMARR